MALAKFVPYFCNMVLSLTSAEDVFKDEEVDSQLLFSLQLLSEVVRCDGSSLLEYRSLLLQVLRKTVNLKKAEGYQLSCSLLFKACIEVVDQYLRA